MLVMKANTESPTVVTAWTDTVQLQTPSTNFKVSFAPVQIQTASEIRASQRCRRVSLHPEKTSILAWQTLPRHWNVGMRLAENERRKRRHPKLRRQPRLGGAIKSPWCFLRRTDKRHQALSSGWHPPKERRLITMISLSSIPSSTRMLST